MNKIIINNTNLFVSDGLSVNGDKIPADIIQTGERQFHLLHANKKYAIEIVSYDEASKTYSLKINHTIYKAQIKDKLDQLMEQMGFGNASEKKAKELKAPMPGLVLDIKINIGDIVKKGDALIVLEAMKMENVLKAASDASIKSIEIQKGKSVEKNQLLITFE